MAKGLTGQQIKAALDAVDKILKGRSALKSRAGGSAPPGDAKLLSAAPTEGGADELLTIEVTVSN